MNLKHSTSFTLYKHCLHAIGHACMLAIANVALAGGPTDKSPAGAPVFENTSSSKTLDIKKASQELEALKKQTDKLKIQFETALSDYHQDLLSLISQEPLVIQKWQEGSELLKDGFELAKDLYSLLADQNVQDANLKQANNQENKPEPNQLTQANKILNNGGIVAEKIGKAVQVLEKKSAGKSFAESMVGVTHKLTGFVNDQWNVYQTGHLSFHGVFSKESPSQKAGVYYAHCHSNKRHLISQRIGLLTIRLNDNTSELAQFEFNTGKKGTQSFNCEFRFPVLKFLGDEFLMALLQGHIQVQSAKEVIHFLKSFEGFTQGDESYRLRSISFHYDGHKALLKKIETLVHIVEQSAQLEGKVDALKMLLSHSEGAEDGLIQQLEALKETLDAKVRQSLVESIFEKAADAKLSQLLQTHTIITTDDLKKKIELAEEHYAKGREERDQKDAYSQSQDGFISKVTSFFKGSKPSSPEKNHEEAN